MIKLVRSYLQLSLKIANLTVGFGGIAMLIYGLCMIRIWQHVAESSPSSPDYAQFPRDRFIHAFLGFGTALCALTCLGHVAAKSSNSCCLFFYMVVMSVLILSEGAASDVFLRSDWEKDILSGRFDDFKDIVTSNRNIFQCISLLIFLAQGCSILLATILRTLGNEGDYAESRTLLLPYPEIPSTCY